jgi:hypothetical protein
MDFDGKVQESPGQTPQQHRSTSHDNLDSYPAHAKENLQDWWEAEQPELARKAEEYIYTIKNARINQIQNDASQNITESIDKASKTIKTRTTQAIIDTKDKMIQELNHSTQENTMKHKQELESTGNTIIDQIESLLPTAKEQKEEQEQDFIKRLKTAMDKIYEATATALNNMKNAPEKKVDTQHLSSKTGRILLRINTARENALNDIQNERTTAIEAIQKSKQDSNRTTPADQTQSQYNHGKCPSNTQSQQANPTPWRQDANITLEELQARNESNRQQDINQQDREGRATQAIAGLRYFNKDNFSHWLTGPEPTQANIETFYQSIASSLGRNHTPIIQYQDLMPGASTFPPTPIWIHKPSPPSHKPSIRGSPKVYFKTAKRSTTSI